MRKMTLYIGLFDKDTKSQKIGLIDAYNITSRILGCDCTITEAKGLYTHEDGTTVLEPSLAVEILDFDGTMGKKWAIEKAKMLKIALNQESVAYSEQEIDSELL